MDGLVGLEKPDGAKRRYAGAMEVRVVHGHQIPTRKPLGLAAGDTVTVGKRSSDWTAFVFVSSAEGHGWVPERYLTRDRPEAETVTSYGTTELAVNEDDVVTVIERHDESGWWWCRAASGALGWVPVEALDIRPLS